MLWDRLTFLANLFARRSKPYRQPESFTPTSIEFVGEQSGPVEDEIKERFCEIFGQFPIVKHAYLARLSYGDKSNCSVGLCIYAPNGADHALLKCVSEVFAAMFNSSEHLDVLLLLDNQEHELRKVCQPFYDAAQPLST